jgi:hypothetical protein
MHTHHAQNSTGRRRRRHHHLVHQRDALSRTDFRFQNAGEDDYATATTVTAATAAAAAASGVGAERANLVS